MSNPNAPNAPSRYNPSRTNRDVQDFGALMAQRMHVARYGAFAYSRSTGRWGWSYQAPDQASAEVMARASCGTADAIVVGWGRDTNIALALGGTRGYGFAWDRQSQRAAQKALQECRSGGNCQVAAVIDTRSNPIEESRKQSRKRIWRWVRAVILGVLAILFASAALYDHLTGANDPTGFKVAATLAGLLALQQASRAVTTRLWTLPPGQA
jgi:hypothetical protein